MTEPRIRVVRLNTRNPIVALAVVLLVVAVLLLVLGAGAALLAGGAVIGGATLLARRVLRLGKRPPPRIAPLDPSREVFPGQSSDRTLPPGRDDG